MKTIPKIQLVTPRQNKTALRDKWNKENVRKRRERETNGRIVIANIS